MYTNGKIFNIYKVVQMQACEFFVVEVPPSHSETSELNSLPLCFHLVSNLVCMGIVSINHI